MEFDDIVFLVSQMGTLQQYVVPNTDLSYIMKISRKTQNFHFVIRTSHGPGDLY